jgi:hypothetical protein
MTADRTATFPPGKDGVGPEHPAAFAAAVRRKALEDLARFYDARGLELHRSLEERAAILKCATWARDRMLEGSTT